MRWLLSLIFVMVTLSSAFATETRTEFITEEVCHAVAGCWVNVKTGECPDCVTETRKIVTVVEIEKSGFDSFVEPIILNKSEKSKEGCWLDKYNPPRPCDWRMGAHKMIAAKKRARKECGGLWNWKWTNDTHTEYKCEG